MSIVAKPTDFFLLLMLFSTGEFYSARTFVWPAGLIQFLGMFVDFIQQG